MRSSNSYRDMVMGERARSMLWLAAIAMLCLVHTAFALDPGRALSQYAFDHWGTNEGFVGGPVYAISQSADGYLWIGTERGLVRFDGYRFTLLQRVTPDSPSIGRVRGLISDSDGNLWIRLEGPRMLLYRNGAFEDTYARFDLQDVTFTAQAKEKSGGILLSGLGDRILAYQYGQFHTVVTAKDNPGIVTALAQSRDGRVWIATSDNGIFRVTDGSIARVPGPLGYAQANAILPASKGGIWVGTEHGLQFWDGRELATRTLPPAVQHLSVLSLLLDRDSNVWLGTEHGIVRMTPAGVSSADQLSTPGDSAITALYEDRDGNIWLGGGHGIARLRNGMFTTYSVKEGLPSSANGPVYVDPQNRVWFAPRAGGLYWMQDGQVHSVNSDGLRTDVVYSISGGGGEIWAGRQHGGLTGLTPKADGFAVRTYRRAEGLAQDSVYSVQRDRDGTVWAGTVSAGVSRLQNGRFNTFATADGLPSNAINATTEDADSSLWFATAGGLAHFAQGHWTAYTAADGLPSSDVRTIAIDKSGVLWVATTGGLAYFDSGKIHIPKSLPEVLREQIFGIATDGIGALWFSTSDHVIRVRRDHLVSGVLTETDLQSYGLEDGLLGVEGVARDRSMVSDLQGRIWVSLNHGLSVADSSVTATGALPTNVRIESMSGAGRAVDPSKPLRLAAYTHDVVFNYAGTNLVTPDRARFRYKLDGADSRWSDITASRQVAYTNLGPGNYRFAIVASSNDGLWNGPETNVLFSIEPAFWQHWWFRAIVAVLCLSILMALYRLRVYRLTQRLNLRFQDRLAERTRIAQELHDTLLQGVLSASLQLDLAEDQLPENSPAKPRLRRVLQLMERVTEEGRNALRGLRAPEAEKGDLQNALARLRQECGLDEKIVYRVIVNSVTRTLRPLIRDEVYRISREALVNAFVHSKASNIEIEIEYASRYLTVMVRDDGCGIDPEVLGAGREGHWGLTGMKERAEAIGATLRLRSRIGSGTELELTVPGAVAFQKRENAPGYSWRPWLRQTRVESPTKEKTEKLGP